MVLRKVTIATTIFAFLSLASIWNHLATAQEGTPPDTVTFQGKRVSIEWGPAFTDYFQVVKVRTGPSVTIDSVGPWANKRYHWSDSLLVMVVVKEDVPLGRDFLMADVYDADDVLLFSIPRSVVVRRCFHGHASAASAPSWLPFLVPHGSADRQNAAERQHDVIRQVDQSPRVFLTVVAFDANGVMIFDRFASTGRLLPNGTFMSVPRIDVSAGSRFWILIELPDDILKRVAVHTPTADVY